MGAHSGIFYYDSRPVPEEVLDVLSHVNTSLGPDGRGCYVADGVALLSFATHFDQLAAQERQPIRTPDGSVLTWDGRLDNREDFLVRLHTYIADDHTDARLIALAFQRWRHEALTTVVGDWSLVHWNETQAELTLARDYAGNRPLYYCCRPHYVVWSTALEPIVEVCGLAGQVNDTFVAGWVTFGPPENQTYYRDVLMVPPGRAVRIRRGGQVDHCRFGSFVARSIRYRDASQYEEHYRGLFTEAVKVRLRARAAVWTELSGGYDSSSITCVASGLVRARTVEAPSVQPVSMVRPDSPESDESYYIDRVEEYCRLRSVRFTPAGYLNLTLRGRTLRPEQGQPRPPAVYTSDLAREAGSHVLLSGELGDVITAGISAQDTLLDHLRAWRLRSFMVDSVNHCRVTRDPLLWAWKSLPLALVDVRRREERERMRYLDGLLAMPGRGSASVAAAFGLRPDFLERTPLPPSSAADFIAGMPRAAHAFLLAVHRFIAYDTLTAVWRTEAISVSYPFAHRPLVEFMSAIPPMVAWSPAHPRAFACAALRNVLPEAIVARRHKGFVAPALSRDLAQAVAEHIDEITRWQLVTRGYADPATLEALLRTFLDGSQSTSGIVERILSVEGLLRNLESSLVSPAFVGAPTAADSALRQTGAPIHA